LSSVKRKNRLFHWFLILVTIIIVFLAVLYFYINSESFLKNAKSVLITQLENRLGNKIEIGSVDSISFHSLQLSNFMIYQENLEQKEVIFQAERVRAKFTLFLPFWKWKNWQLNIPEITFSQAQVEVTRESTGEFDILRKLHLNLEDISENIIIHQLNFQNSYLVYNDELIYNYPQDYLTTKVRKVKGYFDFTNLPKIEFDFEGVQETDQASLALSGYSFLNQRNYSLDFHFQNADITHFQYYLDAAEQFNVSEGRFDLELNLSFSPEWETEEIFWQGKATFREANANPDFLKQIPFEQVSGAVNFSKPEITILGLTGLYHNHTVQLAGSVITEPEVYVDLNIESKGLDASLLKEEICSFLGEETDFSLAGEVDLSGNISGLIDEFYIRGNVFAAEITIANIPFRNNSCSFLLSKDGLIINKLESHNSDGNFSLSGNIDWSFNDIPSYQFSIQTASLSLQHPLFKQFLPLEDLSGNIDTLLQIESQKQDSSQLDLAANFSINSLARNEFALPEPVKGSIKSTINISDQLLSIEQGKLESGKNNASLTGIIQFEELVHFGLNFDCQMADLEKLTDVLGLEEMEIAGQAVLKGNIEGDAQHPEINAELYLPEFSVQDHLLGDISGQLVYQPNRVSIKTFTLTNKEIKLTAEGEIMLPPSGLPEIALSYQLYPLTLQLLRETINYPLPLSGQTKGTGQIKGTWPKLTVSGNLELAQITYDDYQLGEGQLDFILQPDEVIAAKNKDDNSDELENGISNSYSLNLEHLELKNAMMQLVAKGQMEMGEKYPFGLEVELSHQAFNNMIENIYPTNNSNNNLKKFLPARITGKANIAGNRDEQQITLSFLLTPQQPENNPPSQLEAALLINEEGLEISDLRLIQSEGLFRANGRINFTKELDINFQTEQLDIQTLMNLAQIDEVIRGIVDINGSCKGTLDQPSISLKAQIKKGYFREVQFEDLQSELYWNSKTNQLEIKKLAIALEKEYQIYAQGNIPLDGFLADRQEEIDLDLESAYPEIPLNFQIKMEHADLNLLRLFWKDTFSEISGNIDLELILSGTSGNPIVNGTIDINQGIVKLNNLPIQIGEINSSVKIINNQVTIPPIFVSAYENKLSLSGRCELIGFLPKNIFLSIKNEKQKIIYQNILESEADLELAVSNSILNPRISGKLLLANGQLNLNNLNNLLPIEKENGISFSPSSRGENLAGELDLDIELLDPFKLKMTNVEIEGSGRISLQGSLREPVLQGTLALKKGYFIYLEKRFSITDGLISINGFTLDNIDINARAYTNVQGVEITIHIMGNLSSPQVLLSSQPALRETEILSLLTFDRNIQGLSEGEISQLLSEEMVNILFQSLQTNLFKRMERELAEGLGLEFIHLSYDESVNSDDHLFFLEDLNLKDLTLEVGKMANDNLLITYSTSLDFHGEKSLGLDYQISSDFSFSTQFETYSLNIKEEDYRFKFGLEIRF